MGPSGIVGRVGERASIESFLETAGQRPAVLAIEGEAGIGKTTLWLEVVAGSRRRFFWTLSCRCVQAEAKMAFAALGDLIGPVADDLLPDLPAPQRRALEVALLRADPAKGAAIEPRAVSLGFLGSLRLLAGVAPVVIAVDDLQWLDRPSARALGFALRRLDSEPVGIVSTQRAAEEAPLDLSQLGAEHQFKRLRVGALAVSDLHRLFEKHLGRSFAPPTLKRLHRTSLGNPFFALELARTLLDQGIGGAEEPLPVPEHLAGILRARLARLPAQTRTALAAAAALAEPTPALVAAALGKRAGAAALRYAVEAGVIEIRGDRVRFTHPLLASTVYRELPPARRRLLHGRLAAAAATQEERARHLGLAAARPESRVAAALERAGRSAYARGAPEDAAALAEAACRLTPAQASRARHRRLVDLGWYHARSGDTARARDVFEEVIGSARPGPTRGRALHLLGRMQTGDDATIAFQEEARVEAAGDKALSVSIEHVLARYWSRQDLERAERHARAAVEIAERLGDPLMIATALTTLATVTFARGGEGTSPLLQRALDLEPSWSDEGVYARPRILVAERRAARGKLEQARVLFRCELDAAEERGDYLGTGELLLSLACVECEAGAYEAARAHATTALEAAAESGVSSADRHAIVALVDAHSGRTDAARQHGREAMRQLERPSSDLLGLVRSTFVTAMHALGLVELSLGEARGAAERLDPLPARVATAGAREPLLFRFVPDQIEALLAVGELGEAHSLLTAHEARGRAVNDPWALATAARCCGLVLAHDGALDDAAVKLEEALQHHELLQMPFELARTLLVKGTIERRAKCRRAARSSLESALELFERLGTPLWAEKAGTELRRIGGRPRPSGLTPTEERVAKLVAEGKTNREVAQDLFVKEKTVETTLSRVYRKLGVRSRTQLAAARSKTDSGTHASKL
jgi:DNA-binding CsgD family transcriptional regulator/tetratricopeptide (TPR) repeat protein